MEALKKTQFNLTSVNQAGLHPLGDYELAVISINAHEAQRPHYHTYGDIDIFMVVSGKGRLHIAKVHHNKIVAGTKETHELNGGITL
ncbi:hypothetical protein [Legionella israelensis]|nr:hypothetical protein [Legionella israelensis]